MQDIFFELNRSVNAFVWGLPAMVAIIGVGLWLTCRTHVVQVVHFVTAMRATVGKIFVRQEMVPLMALLYFVLAIGVLVMRADAVPSAFAEIFEGRRCGQVYG